MKLFAIVICYNPNIELLYKNITAYQNQIDKILLWDNSPNSVVEILKNNTFKDFKNIEYICCGENMGISYALNYAWSYAKQNKYQAFMTMDQDSIWLNFNSFKKEVIKKLEDETCICGPMTNMPISTAFNFILSNFIITSGMIIPVEILDRIDGYSEKFFVDGIDVDICLRAKKKGYKTYKVMGCSIIQQFGINESFKLFGKVYPCSNYGSKRLYEIFKNHIIIYRRTRDNSLLLLIKGYFVAYLRSIIFYENEKVQKIKAVFKGIFSGMFCSYK